MYIDKMFEELKAKMVHELQQVTLSNFNRYEEWAKPHYRIIEQLVELSKMSYEGGSVEADVVLEPTEVLAPEAIVVEPVEVVDTYPVGHVFTFLKKAFGGVIEELKYPIPEELVRKLSMENENKVEVTGIKGQFQDGSPIYEFRIVDRKNVPNPSLAEIKMGIVEEISGRLVVTSTNNGAIFVNESPACLYINEKDAQRFKISKDDIIDGRFYTNNITNSFRATYKYNTDEIEQTTSVESKRLTYRQNNATESESGFSMIDRLDKTPFLNKKILLVGLEGRMNDFKDSLNGVEEIQLTHLTGDEHKQRIRSQILKSDYVIISTQENSHDASKYVAKVCNEFFVPCKSTSADGLFGVLMDVKELIDQQAA
ncbi:hypothetical protein B2J90_28775 (plasmid) [Bacillus tropicus]|uniref:hypothetical protein n=1 Tax=Bacillus tropicus TaxID=2026188 RepID=UPI000A205A0D|nr:hypothetical protein B2J90_28775 [Bacillus cereus]